MIAEWARLCLQFYLLHLQICKSTFACLYSSVFIKDAQKAPRREGIESQSSAIEERSVIRYYELPSLQTFAKNILSRAQRCNQIKDYSDYSCRPISLGLGEEEEEEDHMCHATPLRFHNSVRYNQKLERCSLGGAGEGRREGRKDKVGRRGGHAFCLPARARRLTGWRLQQILIAFQYGVEFQTKSSVEGREGGRE